MAEPIVWASRTAEGRQATNDGAELLNFFYVPVDDPGQAKSPGILYATPGLRPLLDIQKVTGLPGDTPADGVQGMIAIDSPTAGRRLFGISAGYQFFEFRADGGNTGGSIPVRYNPYLDGSGRPVATPTIERTTSVRNFTDSLQERYTGPARLASDGRRIAFVRGRSVALWDTEASSGDGAFVQVYAPIADNPQELLADEDWIDIVWIHGYFVLLSKSGEIFHSQLHSADFDQLDFATAERNPDPGVGLAAFQGRFYVFGSQSIEVYRESGASPFAFSRIGDAAAPIGCAARDTIRVNEGGVFWLGSDKIVWALGVGAQDKMSNATVEYDIERSQEWLSRAYLWTEEGRRFYSLILTFPDGTKKNWTLDLGSRLWHERSNTSIMDIVDFGGFNVAALDNSQQLMSQALDWPQEDGRNVERVAVSSILQDNRARVFFTDVFLDVPRFDPLPGVTENATLIFDYSDDGKETWVGARSRNLNQPRLRFNKIGSARSARNLRMRITANRRVQIEQAYLGDVHAGLVNF